MAPVATVLRTAPHAPDSPRVRGRWRVLAAYAASCHPGPVDFDFECPYCETDCWVFCPDVGFWGTKYQAPAEVECWSCGGTFHPVFD